MTWIVGPLLCNSNPACIHHTYTRKTMAFHWKWNGGTGVCTSSKFCICVRAHCLDLCAFYSLSSASGCVFFPLTFYLAVRLDATMLNIYNLWYILGLQTKREGLVYSSQTGYEPWILFTRGNTRLLKSALHSLAGRDLTHLVKWQGTEWSLEWVESDTLDYLQTLDDNAGCSHGLLSIDSAVSDPSQTPDLSFLSV